MCVGFIDDGTHLVHGHLVLIHQLDDVDASLGQSADLGPRVVGPIDPPAESLGSRIGRWSPPRAEVDVALAPQPATNRAAITATATPQLPGSLLSSTYSSVSALRHLRHGSQ